MNQSELLNAATAFLEAWERENDLCNRDEANSEAYFAACVKTAELALTFRLALPRGVKEVPAYLSPEACKQFAAHVTAISPGCSALGGRCEWPGRCEDSGSCAYGAGEVGRG